MDRASAPRMHTRCASPPSSPPRCSAAAATVPGAEAAVAKLTAAAAAAAVCKVRRRPSPSRSAERRTLCSSLATRRRVAARYRSWSRPRYGPRARWSRAGFQSRLRSRTARWRRAGCLNWESRGSRCRISPVSNLVKLASATDRVPRGVVHTVCRSAVEAALRHGRKCCARRPRRQMRPHTASGGRRQMRPRAASGGPRF